MINSNKVLYISNSRLPTEKAHGLAILRFCDALASFGVNLEIFIPERRNTRIDTDFYDNYKLKNRFAIRTFFTVDLYRYEKFLGKISFLIQIVSFYFFVFLRMIFEDRNKVVYSRDYISVFFKLLGYRVYFECHQIPRIDKFFFAICKYFDGIIVISEQLRKDFLLKKISEKKIIVARSGVDPKIFDISLSKEEARSKLLLPIEKKIICYTGNFRTFGEEKGVLFIIRSLKRLSSDYIFVAVGGSEKDISYYEEMAEKEGLNDRVLFFGNRPQSDLAIFLKASDVLVMPFPDTLHYRERMSPVKMFEYMFSMRPIVASDLPTIREVLSERNSLVVKPEDGHAFINAVVALENKELGSQLAKEAYSDARSFTWDERAKKIIGFIFHE